jgi:hypothetical protein
MSSGATDACQRTRTFGVQSLALLAQEIDKKHRSDWRTMERDASGCLLAIGVDVR